MKLNIPIITGYDCQSGKSSQKYHKDLHLYVWRLESDTFPWEEIDGFYYEEMDAKMSLFCKWKNDNPNEWIVLCDKWNFEKDDPMPWESYRRQANQVENYWAEIEGKYRTSTPSPVCFMF